MTAPFDELAPWYDAVYAARGKDFAAEAAMVLGRIESLRAGRPVDSLLDVACGTGAHLAAFASAVPTVAGVDGHPGMLELARRRLADRPGASLTCADMRQMDLGRRFDAVTCLFASAGYLPDAEALAAAIARMAAHLVPGGLLVLEPAPFPGELEPSQRQHTRCRRGDATLERVTTAERDGEVLRVRFEFTIQDAAGRRTATETHPVRLCTEAEYLAAMAAAGLEAWFERGDEAPRRRFIGREGAVQRAVSR